MLKAWISLIIVSGILVVGHQAELQLWQEKATVNRVFSEVNGDLDSTNLDVLLPYLERMPFLQETIYKNGMEGNDFLLKNGASQTALGQEELLRLGRMELKALCSTSKEMPP